MRNQFFYLLAVLVGLAGGCAHSEYDLVQPADLAQHIGTTHAVEARIAPIEYRMIAYQDHLIMRLYNRGDTTIQLLSSRSTVVDSGGQSHRLPISDQTILPDSYIKLILPPLRPRVVPNGPVIGIGLGAVVGAGHPYGWGYPYHYGYPWGYAPLIDEPRYYSIYGGDDTAYWLWPDGGRVKLVLVYRQAGAPLSATQPSVAPPQEFTHEFAFVQRRV